MEAQLKQAIQHCVNESAALSKKKKTIYLLYHTNLPMITSFDLYKQICIFIT